MASNTVGPLKLLGYVRRSQDTGTGVSEEIQRSKIEAWAAAHEHTVEFLPYDLDESSFTLDRPGLRKAFELLAEGMADGIVAAYQDRLTRRTRDFCDMLERADREGWHVFAVDTNLDTRKDQTLHKVLAVFAEREYLDRRAKFDAARENAVLEHGVHGGERPPFGYVFSVRGHDKKGQAQRGPLALNADAPKVRAAFEARAGGASWSEVVKILGANSLGAATQMLANRAYLGEARSGKFAKANTHPAIVDEALFQRANRKKTPRSVSYGGRVGAPLGGGILRCGTCHRALTRDTNPRGDLVYRCKNAACDRKVTIQAASVEAVVIKIAMGWHRVCHPDFALTRAVEDALLPALEDALADAEAVLAGVESKREEWDALTYGNARADAVKAVEKALREVEEAEAGRGWLGLTPKKVEAKLSGDDVEAVRSFVQDMVRVLVLPVGRGRKVPVESRIRVQYLSNGRTAEECGTRPPYSEAEVEAMRAEIATWPEPGGYFTYQPGDVPAVSA